MRKSSGPRRSEQAETRTALVQVDITDGVSVQYDFDEVRAYIAACDEARSWLHAQLRGQAVR